MNAGTRSSTAVDFVEEFAAAAERFAASVMWSDMRAPVPACARWTTYDLVVHLGNVHAWAATIVETGRAAVEQNDEPRSSRSRVVSEWYAGKAEDLYEVLRQAAPEMPCWNFAFGAGVAEFWLRRQVHETLIHLLDLEQAAERPDTPVDGGVAADGVDEVLTVFVHRMHQRGHPARLDRPLWVSAVDTDDTWLVSPAPRPTSTRLVPPQPAGAAGGSAGLPAPLVRRGPEALAEVGGVSDGVSASAGTLYRLLWKRIHAADAALQVEGDPARVQAFLDSRLVP